jgi:hypothetical protein
MPTTKQPAIRAWTCICTGRRSGHRETTPQLGRTPKEARDAARRAFEGSYGWEATTCTAKRAKTPTESEAAR